MSINTVGIDLPGVCASCHKTLVIEAVIDGSVQKRPTPDFGIINTELSDGSTMPVCMCLHCQSQVNDVDKDKLMKTVYNGWMKEIDDNVSGSWNKKKRDKYIADFKGKKIKKIKKPKKEV